MGIHTVVTEGGSGLSSGQRQRLIIAQPWPAGPRSSCSTRPRARSTTEPRRTSATVSIPG